MGAKIKAAKGSEDHLIRVRSHDYRFRTGIKRALHYVGQITVTEIKRLIISPPATGRIYRRPGGRLHQASAPGEAPANDTGELQESVDYEVTGIEQVECGDKAIHGKWLELGTEPELPQGPVLPRGHVQRAAETVSQQAVAAMGKSVAKELDII